MAAYPELLALLDNSTVFGKVRVAVWVAADLVRAESDATPLHAERLQWAKVALSNPDAMARSMMPIVLAQNKIATAAQIASATDEAVQAAVNAAVNVFAAVS